MKGMTKGQFKRLKRQRPIEIEERKNDELVALIGFLAFIFLLLTVVIL